MLRSRGIVWVLAAAVVAALSAGIAVQAADNQMKIGVVDVEKLYRDAPRIKTLEDTERARDAELKTLQQKQDLSAQDSARLKELQDMQTSSKQMANDTAGDYQSQYETKTQEIHTKAIADMREAINTVAKDKSYTIVLDKAAVFFGGTEITDDVIAKLDRKVQ